MDINPGPCNLNVLWDQENHVSSDLWQNIVKLIHLLLHLANSKAKWPRSKPKAEVCVNRTRQWNSDDCGVYVAKYVDFFLHWIDIMKEPR